MARAPARKPIDERSAEFFPRAGEKGLLLGLREGPGEVDVKGTESLPQVKLAARNRGDLHSAIMCAQWRPR